MTTGVVGRRVAGWLLMLLIPLFGASRRAVAQEGVAQERVAADARGRHDTHALDELLARSVTLDVTQVSLKRAIDILAEKANVAMQYDDRVVDKYTAPITVHLTKVSLRIVLDHVLSGTPLTVIVDGPARLSIVDGMGGAKGMAGSIAGTVSNAKTRKPLAGASVTVDSLRSVRTNDNGTFVVHNVSPGMHRVTVRLLGYQVMSLPVTVNDDGTATLAIALNASTTVLNEVVTTATGERRRLEVGNAVGTIKADSIVPTTLIRNMSDLLQARVPGVVVSNTRGDVGAPSKIRLRGVNSIALNNDPVIIIDGVRLNAQTTTASLQTNVGSAQMIGQLDNPAGASQTTPLAPSRLDDIDPNTIESIDVLRGPSASSLYGTDAANGVIVIKTKRGHPGSWRFTLSGDQGQSKIAGDLPERWTGWGRQNGNQETASCLLAAGSSLTVAGGTCVQDSVTHFSTQNYAPMSTLGTGTNQSLSANLSGGTESLQQFFSLRGLSNVGLYKMSDVEQRIIARYWSAKPPSWMVHPNTEQDVDGSSRTTFNISPKADVSIGANGIYRNILNSSSGIGQYGFLTGMSPADTLGYLPSEGQRTEVTSAEKRGTLAVTANARPTSWLSFAGTGGGDYGLRTDLSNLSPQYCTIALVLMQGMNNCPSGRSISRGETFVTTANGSANLSFNPFSWLNLRTTMGEQYSHTNFYNLQIGNSNPAVCPLAFGSTLLTPTPVCIYSDMQPYNVTESRDESATAGVYIEETVTAFGLYYTFGVRQDLSSAFGSQVSKSPPNYPKVNLSYPLSDQSFFPKQPYISSLRLRLAYGQSGNQASQTAVLNNYQLYANTTYPGTSTPVPTLYVTALGNATLRPEKSTEWEGGVDVSFLENERVHLEATLYRKFTRDAITSVPLTPSLGFYSQFYNLGNVENRGLELGLTAKVLDTRMLGWDITINASKNSNKLVHKSPTLPPYGPTGNSFVEGYPLYGYWGVTTESYADMNGDGILEQNENIFGPQRFMGAAYPKAEITYGNTVSLWNGALRLSANVDQIVQQTTVLQADGVLLPRAAVDRTTPIAQQAAFLQAVVNGGFIGASSAVRLNEMSATYTVPARLVRQLRAQSLAVTLAGRNLALWTSYAGKDPNVDTSGALGEVAQDDGSAIPQPRSWVLRFNLGL